MIGRRIGKLRRSARFLAPAVSLPSLQAIGEHFAGMLVRHPWGVKQQAGGWHPSRLLKSLLPMSSLALCCHSERSEESRSALSG